MGRGETKSPPRVCCYCGVYTTNVSRICTNCQGKLFLIRRIRAIGAVWLEQRERERYVEQWRKYRRLWRDDP